MSRSTLLPLSILFATLAATPALARAQAPAQVRVTPPSALLPGFRALQAPPAAAAKARVATAPGALSAAQISSQMPRFNFTGQATAVSGPINYTFNFILGEYSVQYFGSSGAFPGMAFYGSDTNSGVLADFNVVPSQQYLLDCSVSADGVYNIATTTLPAVAGDSWFGASLSSFNGHILIPIQTPASAKSVSANISLSNVTFFGCVVHAVSQ
jgi:hypothetical protein